MKRMRNSTLPVPGQLLVALVGFDQQFLSVLEVCLQQSCTAVHLDAQVCAARCRRKSHCIPTLCVRGKPSSAKNSGACLSLQGPASKGCAVHLQQALCCAACRLMMCFAPVASTVFVVVNDDDEAQGPPPAS